MPGRHQERTLRVDPIKCEGHGLCSEAFPEMITADPWNYPVLAPGPVPPHLIHHAEHAVKVCPVLALRLVGRG
ncbi:ferredoxin [Catenulispora sp. MAP12-49]|jgi:ferredoxin|uniref:ferredoxin n=1 Tax=unclassified Catenulispora TaxID=414885 RepID=UPI0035179B84